MVQLSVLSAAAIVAFAASATAQTCVASFGQCGGSAYTGVKTCCNGGVCKVTNTWYSQCVPGTVTTTTTVPPVTTTVPPTGCVAANGQCGGSAYKGSTCCVSGYTCVYSNAYYSQCKAGGVVTTTTLKTTTPVVTTTVKTTTTTVPTTSGTPYGPNGTGSSGNPYAGIPVFVSSAYAKKVDTSIAQFSSNSTRVAKFNALKKIPTYSWLDTIASLDGLDALMQEASAQGAGKPIIAEIVVYNLPGRDCAALASNGEIPAGGLDTYKTKYIDVVYNILSKRPSNVRLIMVLEPDSLPNLATNIGQLRCNSVTESEYPAGVAYAIAKLSQLSNAYIYLDSGHGGWLGWPDNQQKIVPIYQNALKLAKAINPSATIRGFASATANYSPWDGKGACPAKEKCPLVSGKYDWNECIDEQLFTLALNKVFAPAGLPTNWLVDTSRSGVNTIRTYWGSWCNIKGAGLGQRPAVQPASHVDALVWVKPPGDSDGVSEKGAPRLDGHCDPTDSTVSLGASGVDSLSGAPQAGQWFHNQIVMLVDNAVPAL